MNLDGRIAKGLAKEIGKAIAIFVINIIIFVINIAFVVPTVIGLFAFFFSPILFEILHKAGVGSMAIAEGLVSADYCNQGNLTILQETACKVCGNVKATAIITMSIAMATPLLMCFTAVLIYAAGLVMGGERRAKAHIWSTAMFVVGFVGLISAVLAPYLSQVFSKAGVGSMAIAEGLVSADYCDQGTELQKELCKACGYVNYVKNIVMTTPLFMCLTAVLIYAAGLVMGGERRAKAHIWSTAMFVGGIHGLMLAEFSPSIIEAVFYPITV